MIWAAVFLAVSLLVWPRTAGARLTAGSLPSRAVPVQSAGSDELAVAATLDVFGACLRSGMAVATAAAAVATSAPPELAALLRRAADLLALGAEPARAWSADDGATDRHVAAVLRMARRSAASGSALAHGVEEMSGQLRAEAADAATARAERASVLIAGPLGLCYLPAFVCLGIVPVVAGLAGDVLQSGAL